MSKRLLGLAFVAILAAAIGLSVLTYRKAFTDVTWVVLRTDRIGMQLNLGAEVKLRDVRVGEVREIVADGGGATLRLALDPALTTFIPQNVHARLLPRTLFGERYVALVPPADAASQPIRAGAVITQDRTRTAIELDQVLDHSLALLQKVDVDQLAATLNALAAALDGRGERIGRDIVTLEAYFASLNKELPVIQEDIRLLAETLSTYDAAAVDLLAFLRDVTVTATTLSQQRAQLRQFLVDATRTAGATRTFLDKHDDRLIQFGDVTAPFAQVLATYSPQYPCLFAGIVTLQGRTTRIFSNGRMHVAQYAFGGGGYPHQGPYLPGDEPLYGARNGPNCARLGTLQNLPPTSDPGPSRPPRFNDGYNYNSPHALLDPSIGPVGTAGERGVVKALVSAATGTPAEEVSDVAVLLWGPLVRGTVVSVT
jgi:phospholipid/cholesterol/gamma-HCH transport system substrate-binding protein